MRAFPLGVLTAIAFIAFTGDARAQLYLDYNMGNSITCSDSSGIPEAASGADANNFLQSMTLDGYANATSCTMTVQVYCVEYGTWETTLMAEAGLGPNSSGTGSWPVGCPSGSFVAIVVISSCGGPPAGEVVFY